jgi:hypothetical protein
LTLQASPDRCRQRCDTAVMAGAANKDGAASFLKYVTGKAASAAWNAGGVDQQQYFGVATDLSQ